MWEIENLFGRQFNNSGRISSSLIQLLSASLPTFTVAKESYVGGSLEYKFAKHVSWDDIKVEWYDTEGLLDAIRDWRRTVWTEECGLGAANDYKRRSLLTNFLATGTKPQQYCLHNSWPSVIRYGDLSYADSNIKLVEVTVTYDWAEERACAEF